MGIPTLMFFKNGERVDQVVGAVRRRRLKVKVDSLSGIITFRRFISGTLSPAALIDRPPGHCSPRQGAA